MTLHTRKAGGFSLIDLSVLITITALMVAFILESESKESGVKSSKQQLDQFTIIQHAVADYVSAYGYFPCPASPTLPISSADFGVGLGTNNPGTGCNATNLLTDNETTPVIMGAIPIRELGLPSTLAFDIWGNRILYAVQDDLTRENTTCTDKTGSIVILNDLNPSESPLNQSNPNFITTDAAAYVLMSMGEDGVGAYPNAGGGRITASGLTGGFNNRADSSYQLQNHHLYDDSGTGGYDEAKFDRAFFRPNATPDYVFDDILAYGIGTLAADPAGTPSDSIIHIYATSEDKNLYRLDPNGVLLWSFKKCTDDAARVVGDNEGNVYLACEDDTLRKVDIDGNEIWKFTGFKDEVEPVTIDTKGFVYAGSDDDTVRKIDKDGNEIWKFDYGAVVEDLWADKYDQVYVVGKGKGLYKLDSDKNQLCKFSSGSTIHSVATDNADNIYIGIGGHNVYILDSNCNQTCTYSDHGDEVRDLDLGADGYIYTGSKDGESHKIDASCNQLQLFDHLHTGEIRGISLDSIGNMYTGGRDKKIVKSQNGTIIWISDVAKQPVIDVEVVESGIGGSCATVSPSSDVVLYSASKDQTVRQIDSISGEENWKFTGHADSVNVLTVDKDGNSYSDGPAAVIRRVNPDGVETAAVSGIDPGYVHTDIVTDSYGNSYFSSQDHHIYKVDSTGTEITSGSWPFDAGAQVEAIAIDSNNGLLWAATADNKVFKVQTSDATSDCNVGISGQGSRIALDKNGSPHVATAWGYIHKIRPSDCSQNWMFRPSGDRVTGIAVNDDGDIFIGMDDAGLGNYVRKYDSNKSLQWSYLAPSYVHDIAIDSFEYTYLIGSDGAIRKLDNTGKEVTSHSWPNTNHTDIGYELEIYDPDADICCNTISTGGPAQFVYVGGKKVIRKLDVSGASPSLVCTYNTDQDINQLAVDRDGNIYASNDDVIRLSPDCKKDWIQNGFKEIDGLAIDTDGQLWVGEDNNKLTKLDATTGVPILYKTDHSNHIWDVRLGANGSIYTCSADKTIKKRDNNGDVLWTHHHHDRVQECDIDNVGNIYLIERNGSKAFMINSTGTDIWENNTDISVSASIAVDNNGDYAYVAGHKKVSKLDARNNGVEVCSFNTSGYVLSVIVDEAGNIFAVDEDSKLYKADSNCNVQWAQNNVCNGSYCRAVTLDRGR